MIKRISTFLFLILILSFTNALAKDRIAVVDFENKSQHGGWELGGGAADMLSTELVKTGKFSVMERQQLEALLKEQNLGSSGAVDPATAAKIGKLIGVAYIITGAVTEYGQSEVGGGGGGVNVKKKGYHATVDIRMVNVTTGEIVFADSASHSQGSLSINVFGYGGGENYDEKKATEVMREAIKKLAAKITSAPMQTQASSGSAGSTSASSSEILIADIEGSSVTLNNGKNAGLKSGQQIGVFRQGKVIKDPKTGAVIKVKYDKIGVIQLTKVDDSYAEAKVISGSGFTVGDQCRLSD
ncbi:MAG: hypothetical protein HQK79_05125 [Desulfobacterales bacterium]|nr:hypothetical protein [Desulfobacterales bacterium]